MTTENRIVFDLSDLTNFRWECSKCHKDISFHMGSEPAPMHRCPYCSECWTSDALGLHKDILKNIRLVLKQEEPPLRLRLEIKQE